MCRDACDIHPKNTYLREILAACETLRRQFECWRTQQVQIRSRHLIRLDRNTAVFEQVI